MTPTARESELLAEIARLRDELEQVKERNINGKFALHQRATTAEAARDTALVQVESVRALCDQREASDKREAEIEPEDWAEAREHYRRRYGSYPALTVRIEKIRALIPPIGVTS